ncbi:response regulator [Desulfobacterales bacterium HSG17]|nr:response regulator [Desulfobacterales bacterium HSG17]
MTENKQSNILVVDDNPDNLRLLVGILKDNDYKVRPAKDGQTAINSAISNPPDMILMDILMPEMDGYETCRRLKANSITQDIPIIFISALDAPIDKVKAFSGGGVDYVSKPFNEEELLARIDTHLSLRKAQKELAERNVLLQNEIAERKKTEKSLRMAKEEAEVANKAKSTFLANMSHELRTPLNGILGFTQILRNDPTVSARQLKGVNVIEQSGNHLLSLINDVLDLVKIESRKVEVHETDFDLPSFLKQTTEIIRVRAKQKKIEFFLEISGNLSVTVRGDEQHLRQILLNLLGNAVKFTDAGKVTLKALKIEEKKRDSESKSVFRFQIEDTGVGIFPEDMKNIFKPFQQAGDVKRRAEGTGLGLPISRKLLTLMGGTLKAESQPESGSLFFFELEMPVIDTQKQYKKIRTPGKKIIGFRKNSTKQKICENSEIPLTTTMKVLVIDDSMVNRTVFKYMLSPLGFEISESGNGQDALKKAEILQPDAVITDLIMPKTDGVELIRQIRRHPVLKNTPVIASSASVYEEDYLKSRKAGADGFLSKPINAERLYEMLGKLLDIEWVYEKLPAETGILPEIPESAKARLPELINILENKIKKISTIHNISDPEIIAPPYEELEKLHQMANIGMLPRIAKRAEDIKAADIRYTAFANELKRLANDFEDKKLLAFIEAYTIQE